MEESAREQLSQPNLKQVSFGAKGNGITYANMMSIKKELETAEVKGLILQPVLIVVTQTDNLLLVLSD